jgi:ABC-type nitrate/sulfonate/bicarbonate transport system permease component
MHKPRPYDLAVHATQALFVLALVGVWQLLYANEVVSHALLPSPWMVVKNLPDLLGRAATWSAVRLTSKEIAIAYLAAVVVGLAVGFVAGRRETIRLVAEPLLVWAQVVPIVILYPACILLWGLGPTSKIVFAAVYGVLPIAYGTMRAIAYVDVRLLNAATSLGASRRDLVLKVAVPSARPLVLASLRLGAALVIIGVFAGEILGSLGGVGYEITATSQRYQSADSYGFILIALAMMAVLQLLLSRLMPGGEIEDAALQGRRG